MPDTVNHELSEQQLEELLGHLQAIEAALPMLVGIDPKRKKQIIKAGDRSQGFIRKAVAVGEHIEAYLPRDLDVEAMRRRLALMDHLSTFSLHLSELARKVEDTHALTVTQAYDDALVVYKHAKRVSDKEGLGEVVADLGKKFARRKRKPNKS